METDPLQCLRGDPLWRMKAYRDAVAVAETVWNDVAVLEGRRLLASSAAQLVRAVGSIRANLAEGYSRSSGPDRARYFEYALGSARESREWYHYLRRQLGEPLTSERMATLTQIVCLLVSLIPRERRRTIRSPDDVAPRAGSSRKSQR